MAKPATTNPNQISAAESPQRPICGIVRPIADMEPYPNGHWGEVHDILTDAIESADYEARLVSENESVGVILGNIVSNLYSNPIVICDVSGRNPNVMFELGMRIAFEKPTVIVTDDLTPFAFDISPIKHLIYPHSLRFKEIIRFKGEIKAAILATVASAQDPSTRGYLQQFGPIEISELGSQLVSPEQIVSDLQEIRRSIRALESRGANRPSSGPYQSLGAHYIPIAHDREDLAEIIAEILSLSSVARVEAITNLNGERLMVIPHGKDLRPLMLNELRPIKKQYGLG